MKLGLLKISAISLAAVLTLSMAGCGGSSSDTTTTTAGDTTTGDTTTVSYAGSRTISGSVDTSSLATSDQQALRSRGRISRADVTEIVKLYVIGADGTETDTGITCEVDTTGGYTCPNVKGGQDYITRYVKDLGNGRILEMKAPVSVPEASDPEPIKIDPVTTMVVSSVVKAVQDALTGITNDASIVEKVLAAVTQAITETVESLVQSGTIQVPSMVLEADFTEATDNNSTTAEVQNTNLDDIAGIVNTDESISTKTQAVATEAQGEQFSTLDAEAKMVAVFEALGWNDDMPGWVLSLFSGEYDNMSSVWTFEWFYNQSHLTPETAGNIRMDDWNLKALNNLGYSASDLAGWASEFATETNAKLDDGTIFTQMKADIQAYHDIVKVDMADRTEAQLAYMADFNPTIAAMFPESFLSTATFITPMQNMGQLMLVLGYLDIRDGGLSDAFADKIMSKLEADNNTLSKSQIRRVSERLFDDKGGDFLEDMFTEATMLAYDELSIGRTNAQSENYWDDSTKQEVKYLRVEASADKLSWEFGDDGVPHADITATLTYPTATSTKIVDLAWKTHGDDDYGYFGINYMDCDYDGCTPSGDPLIDDFVTGEYVFTFTHDGETVSKTKSFYFIENSSQYFAELTSPKGQPRWNPEWDNYMSHDDTGATSTTVPTEIQEAIDKFNEDNQAYWENGTPTFTPNYSSNNDDTNDSLKGMIVKWKAPDLGDLELPENIEVGYNVNIRLYQPQDTNDDGQIDWNDCNHDSWQQCNTDIYNTWDDDKLITSTSITLPTILAENEIDDNLETWQQSRYELSVDVQFIDKTTRHQVARGGWNNAQFRVGQPTALTGDENITFNGTVELSEYPDYTGDDSTTGEDTLSQASSRETSQIPENFKIALIAEEWGEVEVTENGETYTTWQTKSRETITMADFNATSKTFSVSATWNDIKDKVGHNKGIQIVAFEDANDDGEWQDWESVDENGTYNGENSYWLYNSWMHIDSWGDTTIRVGHHNPETDEQSEESIRVKTGEDANVSGLSIMIW